MLVKTIIKKKHIAYNIVIISVSRGRFVQYVNAQNGVHALHAIIFHTIYDRTEGYSF